MLTCRWDFGFQRAVENEPNGCSAITLWDPTTALTLPGKIRLAASHRRALIQLMGFEAGLLEGEVTSERQLKTKALWGAWNAFGRFSAVLFDIRT